MLSVNQRSSVGLSAHSYTKALQVAALGCVLLIAAADNVDFIVGEVHGIDVVDEHTINVQGEKFVESGPLNPTRRTAPSQTCCEKQQPKAGVSLRLAARSAIQKMVTTRGQLLAVLVEMSCENKRRPKNGLFRKIIEK